MRFSFLHQSSNRIESKFYMLKARPCRYLDTESPSDADSSSAHLYLHPSHFMELDKFMLLRGPTAALDENSLTGKFFSRHPMITYHFKLVSLIPLFSPFLTLRTVTNIHFLTFHTFPDISNISFQYFVYSDD